MILLKHIIIAAFILALILVILYLLGRIEELELEHTVTRNYCRNIEDQLANLNKNIKHDLQNIDEMKTRIENLEKKTDGGER